MRNIKYFGVQLEDILNWTTYIQAWVRNARCRFNYLRQRQILGPY